MKRLLVRITLICVLVLVIFVVTLWGKSPEKERILPQLLMESLGNWHYDPVPVDDRFSKRAYTLLIKSYDYEKRFFLESDLAELQKYQNEIDDQVKQGTTDLLSRSEAIFRERISEVQAWADEILKQPFDLKATESLETDPAKLSYCKNSAELKERWRKILEYQTILRYLELIDSKDAGKAKSGSLGPIQPQLEQEARHDVAVSIKYTLGRMLKEDSSASLERYLNALAGSFDPHTEYFSPTKKEDFDISMTGKLEGIGAMLGQDGAYIKVVEIVPGSAAWRQQELKPEDIILKVAQGQEEPVDVTNMSADDAVKLIRGPKGTEVRLTVKKPDGRIMVIPIIRDVVVVEETYARSAVLVNKKTGKKTGYINLASFYHDFQNPRGRNSATDVRKELEKLKAAKVGGVILDLRNNGGGALEDAVQMAGLFIKSGPIVQVKSGSGRGEVYNDPDGGVVYSGPLVVLVNSYSASASEILAAALQDYHRAVVVGSNSFGKGTVQTIIDLDQLLGNQMADLKPAGSLKITVQKFYRITGGSTQEKGVTADIQLPEVYSIPELGERSLDYSLPWDTVKSLRYSEWNQEPKIVALRQQSAARIKVDPAFRLIVNDQAKFQKISTTTLQPLNIDKIRASQQLIASESARLDQLEVKLNNIKASFPGKTGITTDSKLKDWLTKVEKDCYIGEATFILNDIDRGKR
ncbi:MAG TPA: carboxy terminal-processing peptidase [Bacillota bacterium]